MFCMLSLNAVTAVGRTSLDIKNDKACALLTMVAEKPQLRLDESENAENIVSMLIVVAEGVSFFPRRPGYYTGAMESQ
jgi:hypothetical protein